MLVQNGNIPKYQGTEESFTWAQMQPGGRPSPLSQWRKLHMTPYFSEI